jgi:hypothetical protein
MSKHYKIASGVQRGLSVPATGLQLTMWWGWTSSKRGGIIETASCLEMFPCKAHDKVNPLKHCRCIMYSQLLDTHDFCLANQETLESLVFRAFPDRPFGHIELPGQLSRVPFQLLWRRLSFSIQNDILQQGTELFTNMIIDRCSVSMRYYKLAFDKHVVLGLHIRSRPGNSECCW